MASATSKKMPHVIEDTPHEREIAEAMKEVFDVTEPLKFLRRGNNILYTCGEHVLRISRPGDRTLRSIHRELLVSHRLHERGFPIVYPDHMQGVELERMVGTLWNREDVLNRPATGAEAGTLLLAFHDLTNIILADDAKTDRPQLTLSGWGDWSPLVRIEEGINALLAHGRMSAEQLQPLRNELDLLKAGGTRGMPTQLGYGLLHGDAYRQNFMVTARGVVLGDCERLCLGPREWDLVPIAVNTDRYDGETDAEYAGFVAAYGFDVRTMPQWPNWSQLRLLDATVWSLMKAVVDGEDDKVGFERLRFWRDGDTAPRWKHI